MLVRQKGSFLSGKRTPPPLEKKRVCVGEILGTFTSPGAQSSPCLPCFLQKEREKAREQIMLNVIEIMMRMAFLILSNPMITTQYPFPNIQSLL